MIIEDWYAFYRMFKSEGANKVLSLFFLYAKDNVVVRTPDLDKQMMQDLNCMDSPREPEQVLKRLAEKGYLLTVKQEEQEEVYLLNPFVLWTGEDQEKRKEAKEDWEKLQKGHTKGILNPYRISTRQFKNYREDLLGKKEEKISHIDPDLLGENKRLKQELLQTLEVKKGLEKRYVELKQGLKSLLKLSINLVDVSDIPFNFTEIKNSEESTNSFKDLFD